VWTQLSDNISAFEVYSVAYDAVGKRLVTAAQDTGGAIQSGRNAPLWNAVQGGDGINAFVNDRTLARSGLTAFYTSSQVLLEPKLLIFVTQGTPRSAAFTYATLV